MRGVDDLADEVMGIGFACTRCGACCTEVSDDSNLVIVSPSEVRAVAGAAGIPVKEVADPYPEFLDGEDGRRFTFDWCLQREEGHCRFLSGKKCTVYAARPWICRTYPFMLDGDRLIVSECPGVGRPIGREDAVALARTLLERQKAEIREEAGIRAVMKAGPLPSGSVAVIDSEGVWVVHG
ncbi:YkgJ family cysteine cluster protein [uncultured Methanofollis sp.]|uniref:YkgJ family cysteine cluster protein n=1 Tax=uncultured Methanofollis sp. TaxID=262500 RepID=UPI00262DDF9B|nr:YkgJ family cysteine cluster protein [uncultured Methanofollis sp.]